MLIKALFDRDSNEVLSLSEAMKLSREYEETLRQLRVWKLRLLEPCNSSEMQDKINNYCNYLCSVSNLLTDIQIIEAIRDSFIFMEKCEYKTYENEIYSSNKLRTIEYLIQNREVTFSDICCYYIDLLKENFLSLTIKNQNKVRDYYCFKIEMIDNMVNNLSVEG